MYTGHMSNIRSKLSLVKPTLRPYTSTQSYKWIIIRLHGRLWLNNRIKGLINHKLNIAARTDKKLKETNKLSGIKS